MPDGAKMGPHLTRHDWKRSTSRLVISRRNRLLLGDQDKYFKIVFDELEKLSNPPTPPHRQIGFAAKGIGSTYELFTALGAFDWSAYFSITPRAIWKALRCNVIAPRCKRDGCAPVRSFAAQ